MGVDRSRLAGICWVVRTVGLASPRSGAMCGPPAMRAIAPIQIAAIAMYRRTAKRYGSVVGPKVQRRFPPVRRIARRPLWSWQRQPPEQPPHDAQPRCQLWTSRLRPPRSSHRAASRPWGSPRWNGFSVGANVAGPRRSIRLDNSFSSTTAVVGKRPRCPRWRTHTHRTRRDHGQNGRELLLKRSYRPCARRRM